MIQKFQLIQSFEQFKTKVEEAHFEKKVKEIVHLKSAYNLFRLLPHSSKSVFRCVFIQGICLQIWFTMGVNKKKIFLSRSSGVHSSGNLCHAVGLGSNPGKSWMLLCCPFEVTYM